jgi:hypothetical protein
MTATNTLIHHPRATDTMNASLIHSEFCGRHVTCGAALIHCHQRNDQGNDRPSMGGMRIGRRGIALPR